MSLIRTAIEVISVLSITAYVFHQNRKLKSQIDTMKKTIEEHEEKIISEKNNSRNNSVCIDGVCSVIPPPPSPDTFIQKQQHQIASGTFKLISK